MPESLLGWPVPFTDNTRTGYLVSSSEEYRRAQSAKNIPGCCKSHRRTGHSLYLDRFTMRMKFFFVVYVCNDLVWSLIWLLDHPRRRKGLANPIRTDGQHLRKFHSDDRGFCIFRSVRGSLSSRNSRTCWLVYVEFSTHPCETPTYIRHARPATSWERLGLSRAALKSPSSSFRRSRAHLGMYGASRL